MRFRYDFSISELLLRVESPRKLQIPDHFRPFYLESSHREDPDLLLHVYFDGDTEAIAAEAGDLKMTKISLGNGTYIRRQDSSGRGLPCRIFIPACFAERFCENGDWLMYMALEKMLLPYGRIFLHASAVVYQGKAYIFSAPSGGGKSTHAALWQDHFGAKLLNGDKVLIHVREGRCMAYGSPLAGSSGIYENDGAPIAAICFVKKATENRLTSALPRSALLALYSEAVKSTEEPAFNTRVLDLTEKLRTQIPVFTLECLPEKSAVECVLRNLAD